MKPQLLPSNFGKLLLLFAFLFTSTAFLWAEGSKDFRDYPGYRLFFNAEQEQQLKVFAVEGEVINVGGSHVGISGGFITVYRPDGTMHSIFDGADGLAIINDDVEEINGPTGGGTTLGIGYEPGTVVVAAGETGVWTVRFEYPNYDYSAFTNKLNNEPWTRADQPTGQRVVLAWDVTVTQGGAGNMGGTPIEGRVYSNEYISIQNENGITTSPTFYILTKDGYQYQVDFRETDPWGFPIFSNSSGITDENQQPCYQSANQLDYKRSADPSTWAAGGKYLYHPQAEDTEMTINNKVFFNPPDPNMPTQALVTDVVRNNTHTTWLYQELMEVNPVFEDVYFKGNVPVNGLCSEDLSAQEGLGGTFSFKININGTAKIALDLNDNGRFDDSIDRTFFQRVTIGMNEVFWDGKDGEGTVVSANPNFRLNYKISARGGEVHILMLDIENNYEGIVFTRLNGVDSPSNEYYYDHSPIGGSVSGGGTPGAPEVSTVPYIYSSLFGNNKLLDYWTYVEFNNFENGGLTLNIVEDCSRPIVDSDGDGIADFQDLDDDNDGIADISEYCNPEGGWQCLPGFVDPSGDNDNDFIPNYLDSSDPLVNNHCVDSNEDGICDQLNPIYDMDRDGVPDHLDLDSDNDGITDLVEAGHNQKDINGDGIIDGDPSFFGQNGLFNALASDPDAATAIEIYTRWDVDFDGVPDHDDLDSDNDGINDVAETNFGLSDTNLDGRIDDGRGNLPVVSSTGLVPLIDPAITLSPIPLPPDTDIDGVPDWHDLDSDNDGINDVGESVRPDGDEDGRIGKGKLIVNAYGIVITDDSAAPLSTTSRPVNTDQEGAADFRDLDADGDGINDVDEADQPDEDQDGIVGTGKPIINSNGQIIADGENAPLLPISNPEDTDGDLKRDFQDIDRDNDGIADAYECPSGWPCVDTDGDLLPDVDDLDSDDDKLLDSEECPGGAPCPDKDANNLANFLEYDCNVRNTPQPSNILGGGNFCEGTPIQLTAEGDTAFNETITYSWTGPNDFTTSGTAAANVAFSLDLIDTRESASGTYGLVLKTERGCESQPLRTTVNLREQPLAPQLSAANEDLCSGGSIQLNTQSYTGSEVVYEWFKLTDDQPIAIDTTSNSSLFIENVQPANSGVYTVKVTVDGCASNISNAAQVQVHQPVLNPLATATATVDNPVCERTTVTLSVPFHAGATYQWYGPNGFTSDQPTPSIQQAGTEASGTYYAVITLDNCAATTNEVEVLVNATPAKPEIFIDKAIQCQGDNIALKISDPTIFSDSSLQFNWYTIEGNQLVNTTKEPELIFNNIEKSSSGTYYVEVTNGGCTSPASNSALVNVQAVVENLEVASSATADAPTCEGNFITFSAPFEIGVTYQWYGPNGFTSDQPKPFIEDAKMEQSGTYYVVATLNGCSTTSNEIDVLIHSRPEQPIISIDNELQCKGDPARLNIEEPVNYPLDSNWRFVWYTTASATPVSTTLEPFLDLLSLETANNGSYYVKVSNGSCASDPSNSQSIKVQTAVENFTISSSAPPDAPACEGDLVMLIAPFIQGASYQWYGPNGFTSNQPRPFVPEATADISGEYYAVVALGDCPTTSNKVEVAVRATPPTPNLVVDNMEPCTGEKVTLRFNTPINAPEGSEVKVDWYNVEANELIATTENLALELDNLENMDNGAYYGILSIDGCTSQPSNIAEIRTQEGLEEVFIQTNASIENPICEGEQVNLSVPFELDVSYEWHGPNGFTANTPNASISNAKADASGTYYVIRRKGNCSRVSKEVSIKVSPIPLQPELMVVEGPQCYSGNVILRINNPQIIPDGSEAVYNWYHVQTNELVGTSTHPIFTLTNLTEEKNGTYYAVLTLNGCNSSPSNVGRVLVQEPTESLIATTNSSIANPVCEGEMVALNVPFIIGATYNWYGPNGFASDLPNPSIPNATAAASGDYYAIVTTGICPIKTNDIRVLVKPKPEKPTLIVDDFQKCEGDEAKLSITRPITFPENSSVFFDWYDARTDLKITTTTASSLSFSNLKASDSGTFYTKIIQDGCKSTPSNTVELEVSSIPNETAFIMENTNSSCNETEVMIEAIQPMQGSGIWTANLEIGIVDPLNPVTFIDQFERRRQSDFLDLIL